MFLPDVQQNRGIARKLMQCLISGAKSLVHPVLLVWSGSGGKSSLSSSWLSLMICSSGKISFLSAAFWYVITPVALRSCYTSVWGCWDSKNLLFRVRPTKLLFMSLILARLDSSLFSALPWQNTKTKGALSEFQLLIS